MQVRNVSKSFPGVQALDRVHLDVEEGTVHALVGENGAGKSTLANVIAGLLRPDRGEIVFKGRHLETRNPHDALITGIAMIPQELMPFRELTVAENIFMGHEPHRRFGWVDRHAMRRQAARLLDQLGVAVQPTRLMKELSAAQMQAVEIAKALAHRADLIIMDEPTSAISEREVGALFRIIRDIKRRGVGVIYVSHKMDEIMRIADAVTILRDGRHVASHPVGELDENRMIALMVGRELSLTHSPPSVSAGPVALEVRGLTKHGKFCGVDFSLRRGEVVGLAGLMGAGRTDVANAIFGLAPADAGEVRVRGELVRISTPRNAIALGIGMVTEDRRKYGLVPTMSVKHNITLAWLRTWWIDHGAEDSTVDQQISAFSIRTQNSDQCVATLSGGNQQKVVLARTLLTKPSILILDEPTRGMDIGAKSEMHAFIRQLSKDGIAVLLISSELPELLALSNRLLVMREGRITGELHPRNATQEDIMRHAMRSSAR